MPRTKTFCEEEVLNKAMELFWEKGFHATSMQDLVDRLGINRASLYDTYGGKDALFEKAFARYRKNGHHWLQQLFESAPNVRAGFGLLFEQAINETASDVKRKGCFVVNTTTELLPGSDLIQDTLVKHQKVMEQLFVDYVQLGIDQGELSELKNAQEIGLMLYAFYNGLRVLGKVDTNQDKYQKMVKSALSVLDG